jgi:hypothetical protein
VNIGQQTTKQGAFMNQEITRPSWGYRYWETGYAIINSLIDAAFTACRYAVQPDESTEKYYDRRDLTIGIIQHTYGENLTRVLRQIMTAPEVSGPRADGVEYYETDDPYEVALDELLTILHDIAKDLAVAAYELDQKEIREYFKSLPQSETRSE